MKRLEEILRKFLVDGQNADDLNFLKAEVEATSLSIISLFKELIGKEATLDGTELYNNHSEEVHEMVGWNNHRNQMIKNIEEL